MSDRQPSRHIGTMARIVAIPLYVRAEVGLRWADFSGLSLTMQATAFDSRPGTFTPRLRLFSERFLVTREEGLFAEPVEETLPVLSVCFDYGGVEVRAADRRDGF